MYQYALSRIDSAQLYLSYLWDPIKCTTHPSIADEAWYWPKRVLRSGWLCITSIGLFYERVVVWLFTHEKLLVTTLFAHAQFLGEFGTFVKSTLWLSWLFTPVRCLCCPCFMDEEMMRAHLFAYMGIMLAFKQSYRIWQFTLKLINCERCRMLLSSDIACISDFKSTYICMYKHFIGQSPSV